MHEGWFQARLHKHILFLLASWRQPGTKDASPTSIISSIIVNYLSDPEIWSHIGYLMGAMFIAKVPHTIMVSHQAEKKFKLGRKANWKYVNQE